MTLGLWVSSLMFRLFRKLYDKEINSYIIRIDSPEEGDEGCGCRSFHWRNMNE